MGRPLWAPLGPKNPMGPKDSMDPKGPMDPMGPWAHMDLYGHIWAHFGHHFVPIWSQIVPEFVKKGAFRQLIVHH